MSGKKEAPKFVSWRWRVPSEMGPYILARWSRIERSFWVEFPAHRERETSEMLSPVLSAVGLFVMKLLEQPLNPPRW